MPIFKVAQGSYTNEDALQQLIDGFIYPKSLLIGGLAVDPIHATEQMLLAKSVWNKTGGKQLRHFILAFSEYESEKIGSAQRLLPLAYSICEYYAYEYQIVFGIHDNGCYHIHFCQNSLNYRNGKKYACSNEDDYILANLISTIYIPATLGKHIRVGKIPVFYR